MEWLINTTPCRFTRYPLYRRLSRPQGRSGQVWKISPPPGIDPRNVQPATSRYTDWATEKFTWDFTLTAFTVLEHKLTSNLFKAKLVAASFSDSNDVTSTRRVTYNALCIVYVEGVLFLAEKRSELTVHSHVVIQWKEVLIRDWVSLWNKVMKGSYLNFSVRFSKELHTHI